MSTRVRPLLLGALAVGVVDLVFAFVFWWGRVPPTRILQSIARGVLGREAFRGGTGTAVLGGLLHFVIATAMTLAYYLASRRIPALVRHPWPFGAVYGALLYVAMNFVVLPLSAAGKPSFENHAWVGWGVAFHIVFGLIIAHACRLASR
ncbi:MAG: hypothetical protein HOV81_05820 [Kofleriaceae bacterium]|nr:hypothetical protein [Kofleriaceae bacterium]